MQPGFDAMRESQRLEFARHLDAAGIGNLALKLQVIPILLTAKWQHAAAVLDQQRQHALGEIAEAVRQLCVRSCDDRLIAVAAVLRSEEHTSELQSLMRSSYAVFCLKKKKLVKTHNYNNTEQN